MKHDWSALRSEKIQELFAVVEKMLVSLERQKLKAITSGPVEDWNELCSMYENMVASFKIIAQELFVISVAIPVTCSLLTPSIKREHRKRSYMPGNLCTAKCTCMPLV
jgi:hypothetical protein